MTLKATVDLLHWPIGSNVSTCRRTGAQACTFLA
jgi:hypothetical protein